MDQGALVGGTIDTLVTPPEPGTPADGDRNSSSADMTARSAAAAAERGR
jgi:hypothetical protein